MILLDPHIHGSPALCEMEASRSAAETWPVRDGGSGIHKRSAGARPSRFSIPGQIHRSGTRNPDRPHAAGAAGGRGSHGGQAARPAPMLICQTDPVHQPSVVEKKKTKTERCGGAGYAMMGFVCLVCALADTPDAPDCCKLCKLSVCRSVTGRVERTSTSGKNCQ